MLLFMSDKNYSEADSKAKTGSGDKDALNSFFVEHQATPFPERKINFIEKLEACLEDVKRIATVQKPSS